MKKNVASQLIGVQMITIADGTDFTGTITCEVTIDGGTKTASGGTGPTHEGEGFYTYIPTQAETNGDHLGFSFAAALAISSTVQVYTTFPQTVDNNVLAAGSTGFAAIDTVVDLILVDTGTTIPGTITTLDTNVDAILVDTGTTLPASIATVDGNVDSILVDTGTTLPASLATIDTNVDSILVDTAEIGVAGAGLTNLGASGNDWNVGKTGYSLLSTGLDLVPVDGTFLTAVEDQVWDAVLTGSSHNDATSSGKRLRVLSGTVFTDGTAQSGGVAGTNTFRLAVGDITTDDLYERAKILIIDGAGVGQEVIITSSTASDDSVTITPAWIVTTDSSSVYEVVPGQTHSTIRNGGYDGGYIYLDVTNGVAGTVKGVNGTTTNPSSNIADATTIAGMENIRKFKVDGGGSITLASTYSHWLFDVVNAALLNLGSQDIGGSVFMRTGITGTGTGTDRVVFELCGMSTATVSTCNFLQCGFTGTTTLSSETSYLAWNCFENAATLPIIDMAGDGITATTLELVGYNGRIQINTLTSTDALIVTGDCHLTLDSTCTGGTITIAGDVKVTDNSSGTTIVQANLADILVDTAEIGVAGAGLGDLGGMSTAMIAEVNAAVVDVMKTDTITEMAQQAPPTNPTFEEALMYVYMALVHEGTATSTSKTFSNNAGTVIWKKTLSDDATTYTEAEGVTGP